MEHQLAKQTKQKEQPKNPPSSSPSQKTPAERATTHPILRLQRALGNQAVQRMVNSGQIQTKLAIGQPGDVYEQEADRMAQQVITSPPPNTLQRRTINSTSTAASSTAAPSINQVLNSNGGHPLDDSVRTPMETHFGQDFSQVRVHTDGHAAESAQSVNALAYTVGQDVVFGAGQYKPTTHTGQRLLAHELTHVVQQKQGMLNEQTTNDVNSYSTDYQDASELLLQRQPITDSAPVNAPASEQQALKAKVQTTLPGVEEAARNLTLWLAMPSPAAHAEQIFQTLLLQKGHTEDLKAEFQKAAGRELESAIEAGLSGNDLIRAKRYLQYGTLRLADKIYFAAHGAGTDEDTLYRLMPQVRMQITEVDQDIRSDYGQDYPHDGKLPDGRVSRTAGLLEDEMSDWELDQAKAYLTYGELRPVDQIRIATNRVGTDEDMLFAALEKSNKSTVRQEYQASYNEDLDALLDSELSGKDKERANLILAGALTPFEKIRLAVEGWGTDEQAIYDAISNATDTQRIELQSQFNDHSSKLYKMLDDDLSKDEMGRVEALLRASNTPLENTIEREKSWLTDLFSNTSDALSDESRELHASLDRARADGEISPEEQKEIAHFQSQTEASLEVYKKVRDEIEDTATTILTTAAAIIIGVLSAGTLSGASAAIIAAQLSQAALVSAVARIAVMKVVHGDRFDVFGADGATAFGAGAIDGVMAVLGAPIAKALVGPATNIAEQAASSAFKTLGREMLQKAVEGGITASGGAAFTAAANERTWSQGFLTGLGNVAESTGVAAATGAFGGAALHAAGAGLGAVRGRLSGAAEEDITRTLATGETPTSDTIGTLKGEPEGVKAPLEVGAGMPHEPETSVKSNNEPPITPKDRELLEKTAPKEGSQLTSQELDAELELVSKTEPKSISDEHYVEEVELPNGHKWRRKSDGSWCRFSGPAYCLLPGQLAGLAGTKTIKDFANAFAQSIGMDPDLAPLLKLPGVAGNVRKLAGEKLLRSLFKGEIAAEEVLGRLRLAMQVLDDQAKGLSNRVLQVEGIEEFFKTAITNPMNLHASEFEISSLVEQMKNFPNSEFRYQLDIGGKSGPDAIRYEGGRATVVQFKSFGSINDVITDMQEQIESDLGRLEKQGFMVPGPSGQGKVPINNTLEYEINWSRLKAKDEGLSAYRLQVHYQEWANDYLKNLAASDPAFTANGQPFRVRFILK